MSAHDEQIGGNHYKLMAIQPYEYCQKNGQSTKRNILEQMLAANSIIMMIDSGELANDIVKYIRGEPLGAK